MVLMDTTAKRIICDASIEEVHANANFGSMPKRDVVDEGVVKVALGYGMGRTQRQILIEHGLLIRTTRGRAGELSAKGKRYLRAIFKMTPMSDFLSIQKD